MFLSNMIGEFGLSIDSCGGSPFGVKIFKESSCRPCSVLSMVSSKL